MRFRLARIHSGFIILLMLSAGFCFSQESTKETFFLDGLVYGYKHETTTKLLQKDKQAILEGVLPAVQITVTEDGKLVSGTSTNKKGEFELKISTGKLYRLEFSKTNYSKNILIVDLRDIPREMTEDGIYFSGAEIILNSFKSKDTAQSNLPFGKLFYNVKTRNFDFEAGKSGSKKGIFAKKEELNNAAYLMRRAVNKNRDNVKRSEKIKKNDPKKIAEPNVPLAGTQSAPSSTGFSLRPVSGIKSYDEMSIADRQSEIEEAMQQLARDKANAITPEDSLRVAERESLLQSAMIELENAKSMIELQKREIAVQQKLLFLGVFCLLLLSGFVFMLYRHNKEKKKVNLILKENAKKISDSINYASRIQRSILLQDEEVQQILPESFIYYAPRDVVSGDFYWLSEIDGKTVVAAVDCTGHGVPGAFMSLIGNTLMNEIVNEKGITRPSEILAQMHAGVLKALRQETDGRSQDGMDMSLCVIDPKKKMIEYAGAMNPIYMVKEDVVSIVKPDMKGIGGMDPKKSQVLQFTDHQIPMEKNMQLYMFTDGYMDQFGGPENKKFNTSRFKAMIAKMRSMEMSKQKEVVEETILSWRGDQKQIDDILVIGMRF